MPLIHLKTLIEAPVEVCFDLSRSVDVHVRSTAHTQEKAVAGVTSGLMELHDSVTWQAVHFGLSQKLSSLITAYHRPTFFVDEMVEGAFKGFLHEHRFMVRTPTQTLVEDTFDYSSPLGLLGKLADALFLKQYMTSLLVQRNNIIKDIAESGNSPAFLSKPRQVT